MTFFILHTCIQDAYDHDATKYAELLLIQVHSARYEDFLFTVQKWMERLYQTRGRSEFTLFT